MANEYNSEPLASVLRPQTLGEFVGQQHLLGEGKPLRRAAERGRPHSMLLWGPPGVGKTTLAHLLAQASDCALEQVSAVLSGVKDIREAVARARERKAAYQQATILFVDEVHRFNKSQQDAFLPFVEDGTVTLIGATTENPSFELNNALLSRARLYVLKPLESADLSLILERAVKHLALEVEFGEAQQQRLLASADGDARSLLNILELALQLGQEGDGTVFIDSDTLDTVLQDSWRRFDKGGDVFYEQISALHKAVRGSSPDASLYWLCRMLDGGCDPMYIARRVLRMASEDIGNADPRALSIALDACQTYERLGSPEGELALGQAVAYLACAPKSNAVYTGFKAAMQAVQSQPPHDVPMHLRNAPTKLHKEMGYGGDYRYAHDEPDAFAAGENYFPESLQASQYYWPSDRGLEQKIQAKMAHLRNADSASRHKRYREER